MKNITELRNSLVDNYSKMKMGEMDLKAGKELTNCAGKIISSVKLEMEYQQFIGTKNSIAFLQS